MSFGEFAIAAARLGITPSACCSVRAPTSNPRETKRSYEWEAAYTLSNELLPARMPAWLADRIRNSGADGKANGAFHVDKEIPAGQR